MKRLGYKWGLKKDKLSPGLVNLNRKQRVEEKPYPELVKTKVDAEKLLISVQLSQSLIVGKMSEFFYSCGFLNLCNSTTTICGYNIR